MRIGIDAACLLGPKSGVAEYTANLVRGVAALRPVEFVLFCNSFRHSVGNGFPNLGEAKVRVSSLRFPSRLLGALWRFCHFPPADWFTGVIDVFHSPNYRVLPVGQARLVVTVHDLVVLKFPQYQPSARILEVSGWLRSLNRADAVIAVSENTRRDLLELADVAPEKVHVIHQGYNEALFRPGVPEEEIDRALSKYGVTCPYLLYVGTLEPRKNLVSLVQAFYLLREKGYRDHRLVLAGQKGWLYEAIFEEVERLRLREQVVFTGQVPDGDLPTLMKGAVALVYPSLYEGFGLPPLEAMACGTPVVTSVVSSLPEVVGDAAVLVDPYEVESIAWGLETMISDEMLRTRLKAKGRERAALFSWREAAARTLDLYDRLLEA